jgi:uncharacterized protein YerC
MVRLNKNQLTEEQLNGLFIQLSSTLGTLQTPNVTSFLTELLGYEERIMLAKRLACIILLNERVTPYKIAATLKMSPSTVESIRKKITGDSYTKVIKLITKKKTDYVAILETLEWIMHGGGIMPRRYGLDRYKGIPK